MMARLYNTSTGKWERWVIVEFKTPWRVAWIRLMAFLRYINRRRAPLFPDYELDPETLNIRDPRGERRRRRRDRRDRLFAKATTALNIVYETFYLPAEMKSQKAQRDAIFEAGKAGKVSNPGLFDG